MSENDVPTRPQYRYLPLRLLLCADSRDDGVPAIAKAESESAPEAAAQPGSVEQQSPEVEVERCLDVVQGHGRWDGWDNRIFIAKCGYRECPVTARITCEEDKRLFYGHWLTHETEMYISSFPICHVAGCGVTFPKPYDLQAYFNHLCCHIWYRAHVCTLCGREDVYTAYATASGLFKHSRKHHPGVGIPARLSYLDI